LNFFYKKWIKKETFGEISGITTSTHILTCWLPFQNLFQLYVLSIPCPKKSPFPPVIKYIKTSTAHQWVIVPLSSTPLISHQENRKGKKKNHPPFSLTPSTINSIFVSHILHQYTVLSKESKTLVKNSKNTLQAKGTETKIRVSAKLAWTWDSLSLFIALSYEYITSS
jgi:hypothetical protein